jgi:hypothetical protein
VRLREGLAGAVGGGVIVGEALSNALRRRRRRRGRERASGAERAERRRRLLALCIVLVDRARAELVARAAHELARVEDLLA